MLSEMYHRIIWDSQLCDSTLNHGFYNLTNIYPLPTTQKRYPSKDHSKGPWHRRTGVVRSVDGTLDAVRDELHETFTWENAVR